MVLTKPWRARDSVPVVGLMQLRGSACLGQGWGDMRGQSCVEAGVHAVVASGVRLLVLIFLCLLSAVCPGASVSTFLCFNSVSQLVS